MLRRRPDNTYEFREIERMLYSIQPPPLAPERKEALRSRIMAGLGQQDDPRSAALPLLPPFRERWIAIPAGVGIAAAVIAGIKYDDSMRDDGGVLLARVSGPVTVDGAYSDRAGSGDLLIALDSANIDIGTQFRISLEAGARFSYYEADGRYTFRPQAGTATLVTGSRDAFLIGDGWSGRIASSSLAEFTVSAEALTVHVLDGMVWVKVGNEPELRLTRGLPAITVSITGGETPLPEDVFPPAWNGPGAADGALPGQAMGAPVSRPPGAANNPAPPSETPLGPVSPSVVEPPVAAQPPAGPVIAPPVNPPAAPVSPPLDEGQHAGVGPADSPPPFAEGGAFEDGNPAGVSPPVGDGATGGDPPGSTVSPPAHGQGGQPGSNGSNGSTNPGNGNGPGANSSGGANNGNGPGANNGNGPGANNGGGNAKGNENAAAQSHGNVSAAARGLDREVHVSVVAVSVEGVEAEGDEGAGDSHPGQSDPPGKALGHAKDASDKDNNGVGPAHAPGQAKGKNA